MNSFSLKGDICMNDEHNNYESQNGENNNTQSQNQDNKSDSVYQLNKQDLEKLNQTYTEAVHENSYEEKVTSFSIEDSSRKENASGTEDVYRAEVSYEEKENFYENNKEFYEEHPVKEKKKSKFIKKIGAVALAGLAIGTLGAASLQTYNYFGKGIGNSSFGETITASESAEGKAGSNGDTVAVETSTKGKVTGDVSEVVENVMPSIVAINSVVTNVSSDFFGRQYSQDIPGSGSGIIIGQNDSEILIATNNHVIDGATKVEIVFADKTKASAKVKGAAPNSDLAVVSVDINSLEKDTIKNIKIATLGNSDNTKLGEMAIAIGNALGYGQSVTVGYISALNREVDIEGVKLDLIQTDAAINPGNSGGALLNSKGEVIGINSVKYVDESVESIGYAIPISDAIPIINNLMNRTTLTEKERAYIGVSGEDVTDVYSHAFEMPVGYYVSQVKEGSAAEKAGIKAGDIIVALNDISIDSGQDLQDTLTYTKAGSKGTITVKSLEDGKYVEKVLDIVFGYRP